MFVGGVFVCVDGVLVELVLVEFSPPLLGIFPFLTFGFFLIFFLCVLYALVCRLLYLMTEYYRRQFFYSNYKLNDYYGKLNIFFKKL